MTFNVRENIQREPVQFIKTVTNYLREQDIENPINIFQVIGTI